MSNSEITWDITWEEIEEQRIANEIKENPIIPKIKKYV